MPVGVKKLIKEIGELEKEMGQEIPASGKALTTSRGNGHRAQRDSVKTVEVRKKGGDSNDT